ncbi:MAG: hypothetical protein LBS51_06655 [Oscillospiraceae bacterium]|jgi:hypothetical protein|nr:hypothetical protein [Oscillospiraceae bacterium]
MLFNRNIAPRCAYCRHGVALGVAEIACVKRGIVSPGASCAAFSYEPTKRVPESPSPERGVALGEGDFAL